jgi:hypothetical protein
VQASPPRGPAPTERIRPLRAQHRPPPSLWAFLGLLVLVGILIGFVFGRLLGHSSAPVRDANAVFYESASSTTPFVGAEFTASTYDPQRGMCDKARLKQYLRADQRRFTAWLRLAGTDAAQFDAFVDRLDTARLTTLSPVTDHGCYGSGDCPFSFQAVLAAGTPVWRDPAQGRIVAKCSASSPLSAPMCPPNCTEATAAPGGVVSSPPPTARTEQTLPPETASPAASPVATPEPVRTPAPLPTVTPF